MQRFSRKRQAIYDCLCSTDTHPTADCIYAQLHPLYPDLSLGTVYRNLAQLKKAGRIVSVGVFDGQEHYDGKVSPHAHIICSGCHAILDAGELPISQEQIAAAEQVTGCRISAADVFYNGVCPRCLKANDL